MRNHASRDNRASRKSREGDVEALEALEAPVEVTSTEEFIREMLTDEQDSAAFQSDYLKAAALSSAVELLYLARRDAGKTQADIGAALNTKQPGVARLEADVGGYMAFRRYAEFALACDKVPLILLEAVKDVQEYVVALPGAPLTARAYLDWQEQMSHPYVWQELAVCAGTMNQGGASAFGLAGSGLRVFPPYSVGFTPLLANSAGPVQSAALSDYCDYILRPSGVSPVDTARQQSEHVTGQQGTANTPGRPLALAS